MKRPFSFRTGALLVNLVWKRRCSGGSKTRTALKDTKVIMPLLSKKGRATGYADCHFIDSCMIKAVGGKGGDGGLSFSSIFRRQFDGPDGGEGGNGGHVIFTADTGTRSLNHIPYLCKAQCGQNGRSRNCYGASANNLEIKVPIGTLFRQPESGEIVGELLKDGDIFLASRGGAGGHGNKFYLSNEYRAPAHAEAGAPGENIIYNIELRTMAQVGLVGFPNAGKSTLLRAISRAKPKVAAYPFTTMQPHIGMVEYEDYAQIAVADIPGLIPGSYQDIGMGTDFLRHVERCACLAYVVDLSLNDDPWQQIEALSHELEQYKEGLSKTPSMIVANKIDVPTGEERCERLKSRSPLSVFPVSAKYRRGMIEFLVAVRQICDEFQIYSATSPNEDL